MHWLIALLTDTGMRLSESCGQTREDIIIRGELPHPFAARRSRFGVLQTWPPSALRTGWLPSKIGAYDNGAEFRASIQTFAHYLCDGQRVLLLSVTSRGHVPCQYRWRASGIKLFDPPTMLHCRQLLSCLCIDGAHEKHARGQDCPR